MRRALPTIGLLLLMAGCRASTKSSGGPSSSSAASAPGASVTVKPNAATQTPPGWAENVEKLLNPEGKPAYAGATGVVVGVVRATGDPAPEASDVTAQIPLGKCLPAHDMYRKVFREGASRALADVLVAVTGYQGMVRATEPTVRVEAQGCAFSQGTLAVTFGQRLQVRNVGKEVVTPHLVGSMSPALLLAVPGGAPIDLWPERPGVYKLVDQSHPFAKASVYVLGYPTVNVTGNDGRFRIAGIPVGPVKLSALLPATGQTVEKEVTIEAGASLTVDLELPFDDASYRASLNAKAVTKARTSAPGVAP